MDSVKKLLDLNVPPSEILDNLKSIGVSPGEARAVLQEAGADVGALEEEEEPKFSPSVEDLKHGGSSVSPDQLNETVKDTVRKSMEGETNKLLVLVESQRALLLSKIQSEFESRQQEFEKLLGERMKSLESTAKGGSGGGGVPSGALQSLNSKLESLSKQFNELSQSTASGSKKGSGASETAIKQLNEKIASVSGQVSELEQKMAGVSKKSSAGISDESIRPLARKLEEFATWKESVEPRIDTAIDRLRKQVGDLALFLQQNPKGKDVDIESLSENVRSSVLADVQKQNESLSKRVDLQLKEWIQKIPQPAKAPTMDLNAVSQQIRSGVLKEVEQQFRDLNQKISSNKNQPMDVNQISQQLKQSVLKEVDQKFRDLNQIVLKEADARMIEFERKSGSSKQPPVDPAKLSQEVRSSVLRDVEQRLKEFDQKMASNKSASPSQPLKIPMDEIQKQVSEAALKAVESGKSAWEYRVTEEFNQLEKLRLELQQRQKTMDDKIVEFVDQKQKIFRNIDDKMRELDDFEKQFAQQMGLKIEDAQQKKSEKAFQKSVSQKGVSKKKGKK